MFWICIRLFGFIMSWIFIWICNVLILDLYFLYIDNLDLYLDLLYLDVLILY
jgi:hypothetical protein